MIRYTWLKWLCLLAVLIIPMMSQTAYATAAQTEQGARQAVVIFVDGLSFADMAVLRTYPHVDKWLNQSKYGALTIRPAGPRNDPNAYLICGSGGPALYTEHSGTAYQLDEQIKQELPAAAWMNQLVEPGFQTAGKNKIFFPGIIRLKSDNQEKPYDPQIGLLGTAVRQNGMIVSVYGNADTPWERNRHAALFGMDENGMIPEGDISSKTNLAQADYPYGLKTNYPYLAGQIREEKRPGLLIVELADLTRLYQLKKDMAPLRFDLQYFKILADIDRFIGEILQNRKPNQMVMLLSVSSNEQAQKEKSLLTPLMIWDSTPHSGPLTSLSTRQTGIVNGIDLVPTILNWLNIPMLTQLIGHPVTTASSSDFQQFMSEVARIDHIYENRSTVLYLYVMLQIVTLLVASFVWIWQRKGEVNQSIPLRRAIRLWILAMLFFPSLFLIEPVLLRSAPPLIVLGVVVLLAFGGALLVERLPLPKLLLSVAGFTCCLILVDGFTGAKAMSRSYMGYDPVIAARFYGLGNEYEGVLIGATILLVSALYEGWRRDRAICLALAGGVFGFVLFYMAYPTLGTNAGGFLAGTVGFGIAVFRLQGWRIGKTGLLCVGGGLFAGVAVLIFLHTYSELPLTHVGRIAQDMINGNWSVVGNMVERKLEMNLRLIRISAWSKVFIVSLLVISLLSLRPTQFLRRLSVQYPSLARGFGGITAGSLATLVLNDSGIVSAATSIIFFVLPVLYAALFEDNREDAVS